MGLLPLARKKCPCNIVVPYFELLIHNNNNASHSYCAQKCKQTQRRSHCTSAKRMTSILRHVAEAFICWLWLETTHRSIWHICHEGSCFSLLHCFIQCSVLSRSNERKKHPSNRQLASSCYKFRQPWTCGLKKFFRLRWWTKILLKSPCDV